MKILCEKEEAATAVIKVCALNFYADATATASTTLLTGVMVIGRRSQFI
jgi:hypothetical protein